MELLEILIVRLDPDLPLPSYAHPGDAGADLRDHGRRHLEPGERALVPDRRRDRAARTGTSPWCTRARGSRPGTGCRS